MRTYVYILIDIFICILLGDLQKYIKNMTKIVSMTSRLFKKVKKFLKKCLQYILDRVQYISFSSSERTRY